MARGWYLVQAAWLVLAAGGARADTRAITLAPPGTQVNFTTYAMGLFALPGHYTSFTGTLSVDPARPGTCDVALDVDVGSLQMADPDRVRLALGPKLMDQASYPHLLYRGTCQDHQAHGVLTMHGITRPLVLNTTRAGQVVTAEGKLRRADFGISGLPGLVGSTIKIEFVVTLPDNLAALVAP